LSPPTRPPPGPRDPPPLGTDSPRAVHAAPTVLYTPECRVDSPSNPHRLCSPLVANQPRAAGRRDSAGGGARAREPRGANRSADVSGRGVGPFVRRK
jgi:hypothetical protein